MYLLWVWISFCQLFGVAVILFAAATSSGHIAFKILFSPHSQLSFWRQFLVMFCAFGSEAACLLEGKRERESVFIIPKSAFQSFAVCSLNMCTFAAGCTGSCLAGQIPFTMPMEGDRGVGANYWNTNFNSSAQWDNHSRISVGFRHLCIKWNTPSL